MSNPRRPGWPPEPKLCADDAEFFWADADPAYFAHPECAAAAQHHLDQVVKLLSDRADEEGK